MSTQPHPGRRHREMHAADHHMRFTVYKTDQISTLVSGVRRGHSQATNKQILRGGRRKVLRSPGPLHPVPSPSAKKARSCGFSQISASTVRPASKNYEATALSAAACGAPHTHVTCPSPVKLILIAYSLSSYSFRGCTSGLMPLRLRMSATSLPAWLVASRGSALSTSQ